MYFVRAFELCSPMGCATRFLTHDHTNKHAIVGFEKHTMSVTAIAATLCSCFRILFSPSLVNNHLDVCLTPVATAVSRTFVPTEAAFLGFPCLDSHRSVVLELTNPLILTETAITTMAS